MGITFQFSGISPVFCFSNVPFGVLIGITPYMPFSSCSQQIWPSNLCNWMSFLFYSCRHTMLHNLWSPIQTLTWTYWLIKAKMTSFYPQASYCLITSSLPAQSRKSQLSSGCSRQVASAVLDCWVVALWLFLFFLGGGGEVGGVCVSGSEESVSSWGMLSLYVSLSLAKWGRGWEVVFSLVSAIEVCSIYQIQLHFTTRWGSWF